jgi:hypothetical protein
VSEALKNQPRGGDPGRNDIAWDVFQQFIEISIDNGRCGGVQLSGDDATSFDSN